MRRVLLTVAACALLGLGWSGTAFAGGLIPALQPETQTATAGDQTATQSNDSSVTQKQGNGNVNISPAVSLFGDASTSNDQGNGNTAVAYVDQTNKAGQSQSAAQEQDGKGHSCGCDGKSEGGSQSVTGGDQSVEQSNDSSVTQKQGNDNLNVSPAVTLLGAKHETSKRDDGWQKDGHGASTLSSQGNGNIAVAWVSQSNHAWQSQSAWQSQQQHRPCDCYRW